MANKSSKQLVICGRRCKSCGLCVAACPKGVLAIGAALNQDGYAVVEAANSDDCILCGICRTVCPDVAVGVVKNESVIE